MVILKILLLFILIWPAIILTALIWLFGGWTLGNDMPNPSEQLFRILID